MAWEIKCLRVKGESLGTKDWGKKRFKKKRALAGVERLGTLQEASLEGRCVAERFTLEKFGLAIKNMSFPWVASNRPF